MQKISLKSVIVSIVMLLLFCTTATATAPNFRKNVPGDVDTAYYFQRPSGIHVDATGNVYIVDSGNNCVKKFDATGKLLATLGSQGSGNGKFNNPWGIAFAPSGFIYVVDRENRRVQKFDADLNYVSQLTNPDNTGFQDIRGIATDSNGNVYIADTTRDAVLKFDADGAFVKYWGSYGSEDGNFRSLEGIAVDSHDRVYTAEFSGQRVQVFDADGGFLRKWGSSGTGNGFFSNPMGITVGANDSVYVTDSYRVQKFTSDGTFVSKVGSFVHYGPGGLNEPRAVAVDASGNIYALDTKNNRMQKFTSAGAVAAIWGSSGNAAGHFAFSGEVFSGTAIDAEGYIYVADSNNNRVQKFRGDGTFVKQWGSLGTADGKFNTPSGIAVAASGRVYVVDKYDNRVEVFDTNGNFIQKFGSWGTGLGQLEYPTGIAVGPQGYVYVANYYSHLVQVFSETGTPITSFGGYGTADGKFNTPSGIAVASNGNVYVADSVNRRVQKFTATGQHLATFGTSFGTLKNPRKLAADAAGYLYVADTDNNRIVKFSPAGAIVNAFGTQGKGDGQFNAPNGVAVDENGFIYVADTANSRIQKFDSTGGYIQQWGGWDDGLHAGDDGNVSYPTAISTGPDGYIWVADYNNSRINQYTKNGAYIGKVGASGPSPSQGSIWSWNFEQPYEVYEDSGKDVYICDLSNSRVLKNPPLCTDTSENCQNTLVTQVNPRGMTRDNEGNFYLASTQRNNVSKFDSNWNLLLEWGSWGSDTGKFIQPEGILAIDDRVYVSDSMNNRIQVFDKYGNFLEVWKGNGPLFEPQGLAVDANDNLYVVDASQGAVIEFNAQGDVIDAWGSQGSGQRQFQSPSGIAINKKGSSCIVDAENNRIVLLGPATLQNGGVNVILPILLFR